MSSSAAATAASPTADDSNIDRAALEAEVEALQEENRKHVGKVDLLNRRVEELQRAVRKTLSTTEEEEDKMTNAVLRKVDALAKHKAALQASLQKEEGKKAALDAQLQQLLAQSAQLRNSLLDEEDNIRARLERQLEAARERREEFESRVRAEAANLSQLQQHVERLDPGPLDSQGPFTLPPVEGDGAPGSLSDEAMVLQLSQEVQNMEELRQATIGRLARQDEELQLLAAQIAESKRESEQKKELADGVRRALTQTNTAAHELSANTEVAAEYQGERELWAFRRSASNASSTAHSVASTPTQSSQQGNVLHGVPGEATPPSGSCSSRNL